MVRITKVYTRKGDKGITDLVGGKRVLKDSVRVEAYGTVDELNAAVGLARVALSRQERKAISMLIRVQNELFDLGTELATPDVARRRKQPAISARHIEKLEGEIDEMNAKLPALPSFILPGGGEASARLHVARTISRRAERRVLTLRRQESVGEFALIYLNRLSDALFVLGRWVARGEPELLWEPQNS